MGTIQGLATARVMVAIAVALQIFCLSVTMATGGMRVMESNIFAFGRRPKQGVYDRTCSVMDRLLINGDPARDVYREYRLKGGTQGFAFLAWMRESDANGFMRTVNIKSHVARGVRSTMTSGIFTIFQAITPLE